MKDDQVFWDASALVPVCIREDRSSRARQLLRQYPQQVVWWGTLAEVRSALARALRNQRITTKEKEQAIGRLQQMNNSWDEIAPDRSVRALTLQLLDTYPLRTGDALQLAAALVWCSEKPQRRIFVCFDERLATVAEELGFNIITA